MNGNGNGWLKPVFIGVAILVCAAAIVGAGSNSISNSVNQRGIEVKLEAVEKEVIEQGKAVSKIDVMDERIKDIKDDVRKILAKLP